MHYIKERDIGDQRRDQRRAHDIEIGNADDLGHDESRRAHDRRHQLAVRRCRHFDGSRLVRRQANLFHQRDGEGAGGYRIGNRRARHHAGQARGDNRRFGRAAAHPAEPGKGYIDKIFARACAVEKSAEQHEQKYEICRDCERHAKDAGGREILVIDDIIERNAAVAQKFRQIRTDKTIGEKDDAEDWQGRAERAARRFEQQNDHHHANPDIGIARQALAHDDAFVIPPDIERRGGGDDTKDDIEQRNITSERALAAAPWQQAARELHPKRRARFVEGGIGKKNQQDGKGKMPGARDGRVNRLIGDVELVARPGDTEQHDGQARE